MRSTGPRPLEIKAAFINPETVELLEEEPTQRPRPRQEEQEAPELRALTQTHQPQP